MDEEVSEHMRFLYEFIEQYKAENYDLKRKLDIAVGGLKDVADGKYRYYMRYDGDKEIPSYYSFIDGLLRELGERE